MAEHRYRMSVRELQMLAAAYAPVIGFASALIAARVSGRRRQYQPQAPQQ